MRAPGTPAPGRPVLPRLLPGLLLLLLLLTASGLAVPCVSGGLPKPTNITFLSVNMKNVLHWNPPQGLRGVEVTYTVQYFIYGQKKWLSASECRSISRTYCDLSAETSDYEHQYYAKVKAIQETKCSEWTETGRFYPFLETQVGPPEVALTSGEKFISITLTAPEKWKRNPTDDSVSMQQIYSNLRYNVSVYDTKSRRRWSQCIANSTLVLSWLEPSTLYCVHVESLVPGPPRLTLPSQKQCISTLEDQMSALKVKVIFWYVLPTSVIVFLFSVIGYSVYRYIHVGREKHPSNLILIYGNEIKRVFEPAEAVTLNFVTLNVLDDSKISQKDMSFLEKSSDGSSFNDPEFSESQEPHLGEVEGQHVGYSSHLMDVVCSAEQSDSNARLACHDWLSSTTPTGEADAEHEYGVPTDFYRQAEDHQFCGQEEASRTGELPEPRATLANLGPPLEDLHHLGQEHPGSEEGPEEEPSTTLVDWDPQTGRLCIPSLPSFGQDPVDYGHYEKDQLLEDGLLSRFYENQVPDKPEDENENYLIQFMEEWGLHVQMES
ncbi:interleukin-20 receptor subunit alpha isoform X2 [Peromyscus californicus insignis]|uniref:interleukin-20 receptor subunit alpha isoform X2 n=1 Tax=Peromyscus californicus insignis TaxID=564181 RepID=UPI0022A6EB2B|nr:interleukin-20 receptor subunit alpha isoform X2 [Peromyscus californicus insignis]